MIRPSPALRKGRRSTRSLLWMLMLLAAAPLQQVAQASDAATTSAGQDLNARIRDISTAVASQFLGHRSAPVRLGDHEGRVGAIAHRLADEVRVPNRAVHDLAAEIVRKSQARRLRLHVALRTTGIVVAITLLLLVINWIAHRLRHGPGPPKGPRDRRLHRYLATDPRALFVFAPMASGAQAGEIGHTLVSDRLAARVTFVGGIRPLQPGGDEGPEREAIAIIHSTRARVRKLARFLSRVYGYRVSDVKPYPIHWAPKSYTGWVEEATHSGPLWRRIWRYIRT